GLGRPPRPGGLRAEARQARRRRPGGQGRDRRHRRRGRPRGRGGRGEGTAGSSGPGGDFPARPFLQAGPVFGTHRVALTALASTLLFVLLVEIVIVIVLVIEV